jgi:hypothetical protein
VLAGMTVNVAILKNVISIIELRRVFVLVTVVNL